MQTFTSNYHTFKLRFIRCITRKHAVTSPGYKSNPKVLYIAANYNGTTSWHNYLGIHYMEKDIMCSTTKKKNLSPFACIENVAIERAVLIFPLNRWHPKAFKKETAQWMDAFHSKMFDKSVDVKLNVISSISRQLLPHQREREPAWMRVRKPQRRVLDFKRAAMKGKWL